MESEIQVPAPEGITFYLKGTIVALDRLRSESFKLSRRYIRHRPSEAELSHQSEPVCDYYCRW
jgi:hypothetical protein